MTAEPVGLAGLRVFRSFIPPKKFTEPFFLGVNMTRLCFVSMVLGCLFHSFTLSAASVNAQDAVFSGPQVGEQLPRFSVRAVFDDAGKDLDFIELANGRPIVLVFVHDVNRMSISMTRILTQYTVGRADSGLATGVIFLNSDVTEAENTLQRIRHAMAPGAPTGISIDGAEGPGNYGLNRKVMLTILVGKDGQVTANHALIQPSLQVDLPKILESIVAVAGGPVPKLSDLEGMPEMKGQQPGGRSAVEMRPLLAPLIRRDATPEEVDRAAKICEAAADRDIAVRQELGRIAKTIVDAGKLSNYGTPRAQEYLSKWAKSVETRSGLRPAVEGDVGAGKPTEDSP
jgi:hypothetical protein